MLHKLPPKLAKHDKQTLEKLLWGHQRIVPTEQTRWGPKVRHHSWLCLTNIATSVSFCYYFTGDCSSHNRRKWNKRIFVSPCWTTRIGRRDSISSGLTCITRIIDYADGVFGVWDYVLFAIMLSISCLIGIFLAWKGIFADNLFDQLTQLNLQMLGLRKRRQRATTCWVGETWRHCPLPFH